MTHWRLVVLALQCDKPPARGSQEAGGDLPGVMAKSRAENGNVNAQQGEEGTGIWRRCDWIGAEVLWAPELMEDLGS